MTQADKRTDDKAAPWLYCYNEPYSEEGRDGRGFAGTGGHVKWSLPGLDEVDTAWSDGMTWVRGSEVLIMVAERGQSLCILWENRTFLSPWDSTWSAHLPLLICWSLVPQYCRLWRSDPWVFWKRLDLNEMIMGRIIFLRSKKRPECLFFHLRMQEPPAACQEGRLSFKP